MIRVRDQHTQHGNTRVGPCPKRTVQRLFKKIHLMILNEIEDSSELILFQDIGHLRRMQ